LRPPDGVELRFHEGALTASGSAPQSWIDDARRLAPAIAGVRQFTFEGETVEARLAAVIEGTSVHFAKGDSVVDAAQLSTIQMLGTQLEELDELLASSRRRARVEILGYADSDGPDNLNTQLSQARADRVRSLVAGRGLTSIDLVARGLGRAPLRPGASEAEHQQNRRASLRVSFIDDAPRGRGLQ
jgi:OOP family OmpA-OmpF porin